MCNPLNRQEEDNVEEKRARQRDATHEIFVAQIVKTLIVLGHFCKTTVVLLNVLLCFCIQ